MEIDFETVVGVIVIVGVLYGVVDFHRKKKERVVQKALGKNINQAIGNITITKGPHDES